MVKSMLGKIKSNVKSGLTIALVSIPLSISLAVASGVSPVQGIITAVWAGLVAAFFGGSNYNIIGPTGALSGVIAAFVLAQGVEQVSMLAILAGIMILVAYALRFERYLVFIPSSVIHGFTLGVACIISLSQVNAALGIREGGGISSVTCGVFVLSLAALMVLRKKLPLIPGAIVLAPVGMLVGYWGTALGLDTLGSTYGELSAQLILLPRFTFSHHLVWPALIIALIALLETMLSAKIADTLTKTRHNARKEMVGLGLANIVSGLVGGIPATAALARTVFNIKMGATSSASALISSVLIAVLAVLCLSFFTYLPIAVIAAILVNVSLNMVEKEHFGRLFAYDKVNFFIALFVAFLTVYKDPVIGILGGAGIALLFFVEKLSHGYHDLTVRTIKGREQELLIYTFKGKLSYLNVHAHVARFETGFAQYERIVLNLQEVYALDIDGVDALDEIIEIAHKKNKTVLVVGINPAIKGLITAVSAQYRSLEQQGCVFDDITGVIEYV